MKLSLDFYVLLTEEFGFRINFTLSYRWLRRIFKQPNKQGRAERKLLHVKMSSGATYAVRRMPYAVRRRRTRPRAIPLALTKISRIDRLPCFLTHGALRARARRARAERRYYVFTQPLYIQKSNTLDWDSLSLTNSGILETG